RELRTCRHKLTKIGNVGGEKKFGGIMSTKPRQISASSSVNSAGAARGSASIAPNGSSALRGVVRPCLGYPPPPVAMAIILCWCWSLAGIAQTNRAIRVLVRVCHLTLLGWHDNERDRASNSRSSMHPHPAYPCRLFRHAVRARQLHLCRLGYRAR